MTVPTLVALAVKLILKTVQLLRVWALPQKNLTAAQR